MAATDGGTDTVAASVPGLIEALQAEAADAAPQGDIERAEVRANRRAQRARERLQLARRADHMFRVRSGGGGTQSPTCTASEKARTRLQLARLADHMFLC